MSIDVLKGKRLLLIPASREMYAIVERAKQLGIYTIVTDFYTSWDESPAKKIADEAYDISFNDLDALAVLCEEKHIDGVFSAFSEFSVMAAAKLCERIGKPFYASVKQLEIMRNKAMFKALCEANGLKTVKEFKIDLTDLDGSIRAVEYPVVVKPVDNGGSRGITVAYDEEMLRNSIEYALSFSASKEIIVEKYMSGQECNLTYSLQNGNVVLSAISDSQLSRTEHGHLNLPYAWLYPSRYYKRCLEEVDDKVKKMFQSIGMTDGSCFMQCFAEKDGFYFFEAGYRVGGGMNYILQNHKYGKNYLDLMLCYSITGDSTALYDLDYDDFESFTPCGNLIIVLNGGVIAKYIGFEEISRIPGVLDVGRLKPVGTEIKNTGNYGQYLCRIIIMAESPEHFADIVDQIYQTVDVLDENGSSMLLGKFDTDIIRTYWN